MGLAPIYKRITIFRRTILPLTTPKLVFYFRKIYHSPFQYIGSNIGSGGWPRSSINRVKVYCPTYLDDPGMWLPTQESNLPDNGLTDRRVRLDRPLGIIYQMIR